MAKAYGPKYCIELRGTETVHIGFSHLSDEQAARLIAAFRKIDPEGYAETLDFRDRVLNIERTAREVMQDEAEAAAEHDANFDALKSTREKVGKIVAEMSDPVNTAELIGVARAASDPEVLMAAKNFRGNLERVGGATNSMIRPALEGLDELIRMMEVGRGQSLEAMIRAVEAEAEAPPFYRHEPEQRQADVMHVAPDGTVTVMDFKLTPLDGGGHPYEAAAMAVNANARRGKLERGGDDFEWTPEEPKLIKLDWTAMAEGEMRMVRDGIIYRYRNLPGGVSLAIRWFDGSAVPYVDVPEYRPEGSDGTMWCTSEVHMVRVVEQMIRARWRQLDREAQDGAFQG